MARRSLAALACVCVEFLGLGSACLSRLDEYFFWIGRSMKEVGRAVVVGALEGVGVGPTGVALLGALDGVTEGAPPVTRGARGAPRALQPVH